METQIPLPYWYRTLCSGLSLLVVCGLVCFKSQLFYSRTESLILLQLPRFHPWFYLDVRNSSILLFLCMLYLANIGRVQCFSLGSLLAHERFCYIQGWCGACFASQTSIGFVLYFSLDSFQFARFVIFSIVLVCVLCLTNIRIFCLTHAVMSYDMTYDHFGLLWYVHLSTSRC